MADCTQAVRFLDVTGQFQAGRNRQGTLSSVTVQTEFHKTANEQCAGFTLSVSGGQTTDQNGNQVTELKQPISEFQGAATTATRMTTFTFPVLVSPVLEAGCGAIVDVRVVCHPIGDPNAETCQLTKRYAVQCSKRGAKLVALPDNPWLAGIVAWVLTWWRF